MLEGKIIKFHREQQDMMQKELGDGICSSTHISKIERGLTEVSMETIDLLSNRLGIEMEKEINTYIALKSLLKQWHESIIMKLNPKIEILKKQLESIELLKIPDIYRAYSLILTRYYLSKGENQNIRFLIDEMDTWSDLTLYEKNMLLHIKGIHNLNNHEYYEAISLLQEINLTYYNNEEYYYHLAFAYHSLNSRVLAYHYASKALDYFTEKSNFTRMIEAEMLMLIQIEQDNLYDLANSEYQRLIDMAENFGFEDQKSKLSHNLAYLQLRQGEYKKASDYYKQSMDIRGPLSSYYLGSMEGYLNASTKEGVVPNEELLQLAKKGIELAIQKEDLTFKHLFYLHLYHLENETERYYAYLETEAYPYFKKSGYALPTEDYLIKLFDYHMKKQNIEKANHYAKLLVDNHRRNNHLV